MVKSFQINEGKNGFLYISDSFEHVSSLEDVKFLRDACNNHLRMNEGTLNRARKFFSDQDYAKWEKIKQAKEMEFDIKVKKMGFIYLAKTKFHSYTKIGFSKNPKSREKTLQGEDPCLEIFFTKRSPFKSEAILHGKFLSYRIRGEWFNLSEDQIEEIKNSL